MDDQFGTHRSASAAVGLGLNRVGVARWRFPGGQRPWWSTGWLRVRSRFTPAQWGGNDPDIDYHDLDGDYFTRQPAGAMRRIIRQPNALGFTLRFDPIQGA
jgi:hypothetical protein